MMLPLHGGQLRHAPLFHRAARCFQRVFRTVCIRIELLEEIFLILALCRPGGSARKWPSFCENLNGRAEAGDGLRAEPNDG